MSNSHRSLGRSAGLIAFFLAASCMASKLVAQEPWFLPAGGFQQAVASPEEDDQPEWLQWIASKSKSSTTNSWWSGWSAPKMPSMSWSSSKAKRPNSYKSKKTSWQKFQDSSKQAWRKTAEVLDPYPDPKPTPPSSKKSSSWFSGWSKPKEKRIESVPEFLNQPPPK